MRYSPFPKPLAECIEPLLRPVLKTQGLAGTRILRQWHAIVGVALANHSLPEKLSFPKGKKTGGTLTISVENGFATELQHLQPVILERLATYFGYRAVERIVIGGTQLPAAAPKPAAAPAATLPAECTALAKDISDEHLKEALTSLAATFSGQRT